MGAPSLSPFTQLYALTSNSKNHTAYKHARKLELSGEAQHLSAQWWKEYAKVALKLGRIDRYEPIIESMRLAPGFAPYMEGDVRMKLVERNLQKGRRAGATIVALNMLIPVLYEGHASRLVRITAARARLEYTFGDLPKSARLHQQADDLWHGLGDQNGQWARTNRFHLLRTLVALNNDTDDLYERVASDNWQSAGLQRRAWLMHHLGPFWLPVDHLVER